MIVLLITVVASSLTTWYFLRQTRCDICVNAVAKATVAVMLTWPTAIDLTGLTLGYPAALIVGITVVVASWVLAMRWTTVLFHRHYGNHLNGRRQACPDG